MRDWFVHLQMAETGNSLGFSFTTGFVFVATFQRDAACGVCVSKVERLKCQKQQWKGLRLKAFQVLLCLTLPIHFEITVAALSGQSNIVATHYSMSSRKDVFLLDKANVPKVQICHVTLTRWAFLQLVKTFIFSYSQQPPSGAERETHEFTRQHYTLFL